jgi:biotin synthase-related radical SAM superfamily protein
MSQMGTRLSRGDLAPDTRADAASYLTRTGNADLLPILGLVGDDRPLIIDSQLCCPACQRPYRSDGRTSCRRPTCSLGPSARPSSGSAR